MGELGYFEESTNRPGDWQRAEAAKQEVADELAFREWNLARWSIGLTALVSLGAIAGAAIARGNLK